MVCVLKMSNGKSHIPWSLLCDTFLLVQKVNRMEMIWQVTMVYRKNIISDSKLSKWYESSVVMIQVFMMRTIAATLQLSRWTRTVCQWKHLFNVKEVISQWIEWQFLQISWTAFHEIRMRKLFYYQLCAEWVPTKNLTQAHK